MEQKKVIGILEMSEASTQFYIQLLNKHYGNKHLNDTHLFKLIPTNFEAINNLLPNSSEQLDSLLSGYLKKIGSLPIEGILIPNITIHETVDKVWDTLGSKTPIIHPLSVAINRMHKAGQQQAVLFGSKYTMTAHYIKNTFANANLTIVPPSKEEIDFIDWVRKQVYAGDISTEISKKINHLIRSYSEETTVLLACTELSIASKIKNKNVLDLSKLQIEQAISLLG